jgi:hypothetical protein
MHKKLCYLFFVTMIGTVPSVMQSFQYFNCILGSHLEKLLEAWACFKPILACFRVVSPVESLNLDFYDQYKALVLSVCLLVSKCLLDMDLEMKFIVKYGQAGR